MNRRRRSKKGRRGGSGKEEGGGAGAGKRSNGDLLRLHDRGLLRVNSRTLTKNLETLLAK